jgi:small subunit ribosomal protein S5
MADEKSTQKKRRGPKPGGPAAAAPAGDAANPAAPGGDGGGGGRRRRGGKNDKRDQKPREEEREELDERVVDIKRVAKVIKGGRRFAFRTTVIVGDGKGRVGIGIGKARAVPDAIRKGSDRARRNMNHVSLSGSTIPHPVIAEYGGARVMLRPATPGTGVIAGGGVRAVLEAAGVRDILSKSQGSNNLLNVTLATLEALHQLRSAEQVAAMRGKDIEEVRPFFEKKKA